MLTAQDLWKSYGDRTVVAAVNFSLQPGEVLGLLGPNGAGKTTTVGMCYGQVIPSRGHVQFDRWQIPKDSKLARSKMGIVTQEDNLDPDFSVFNNLAYFAHHYGITGAAARQRAGELLAQVHLETVGNTDVDTLSGGMKRRLVLARALINRPQVVFLDEPTTGLDPDARQDFWQLVIQLKHQGCGIVLTTHYMDEAQRLCDRLLLMQEGRVMDEGKPLALIERTIGREVAEVEGLPDSQVAAIAQQFQVWWRQFGHGHVIALPSPQGDALWQHLQASHPPQLSRRLANLEDVFLRLTGTALDQHR
ncbi:ABC transporter ATP-binding protein [Prochlorothrix hollandica]|uniref:Multidrug ABC transporter ATPase n=1 Tax=Prochlorothrix hollandica PCC 9006 = CALU 1027 TaxID=317619 RepID=A0A0M2PV20_PROHO|nr:ABC transporter ATP-binding protein [Prochlorothrix hollandica]KKJ00341.1 multidrug ABC transporter ATPase [Prochlorothrix hollandica PCC 9006 = CALU 1027]